MIMLFVGWFERSIMVSRVQIEITNTCNNACVYCPHKQMTRKFGFMSMDNIRHILDKCKEQGVKEVYPMLNGEPTLHPQFLEVVKLIKSYGFRCPIITNFSNLNEEKIKELSQILDGNDSLVISLDAVTPELYRQVRGGNPDQVLKNLEVLKSTPFNCYVAVQVIRTKFHTEEDVNNVRNFFRGSFVQVSVAEVLNWGGAIESKVVNKRNSCSRLVNDICIFLNGDVPLCCIDYDGKHNFGNIFGDSLDTIDKRREKFITEFPQGLCVTCNGRW